jgi:hypothetical protein
MTRGLVASETQELAQIAAKDLRFLRWRRGCPAPVVAARRCLSPRSGALLEVLPPRVARVPTQRRCVRQRGVLRALGDAHRLAPA